MIGYIMINHEHKFIFIHIPKCAGMSIGRTLINLTNENEIVGLDTLTPKPEDYSGFKIHHNRFDEQMWKDYFVFTFIREPKDRLYSQYTYRNFLYYYDYEYAVKNMRELFIQQYGLKVPHTHRTNENIREISNHYGEWIHYPSQIEFLQGKFSDDIDKQPYLDFIGRYETLQEDFDYVCKKIGLPKTKLPHTNKSINKRGRAYEQKIINTSYQLLKQQENKNE